MSRAGLITSIIVILIIIGVIAAWLMTQGAPPATPTPTPTQTASPTPTPTQTPTSPTPAPAKVKIRIWGPWSGAEYEYFKQVLDEYQRLNPNVEFEYVTRRAEDIAQILPTQLEARQAPADVIFTSFGWFVVEMAKRGHLVDLTNVVNEADLRPGFSTA